MLGDETLLWLEDCDCWWGWCSVEESNGQSSRWPKSEVFSARLSVGSVLPALSISEKLRHIPVKNFSVKENRVLRVFRCSASSSLSSKSLIATAEV